MINIATRKSPLALKQTGLVITAWQQHDANLNHNIKRMSTQGDQQLSQSLAKIGGKGLFIKELEKALLNGSADLAIHSMKDMPTELHPELEMMSILPRADVRDAFVSQSHSNFTELPEGSIVGTSSLRRATQLKAWRPDIQIKPLRGNVNTRLKKLAAKEFDAIILASAGLERLGLTKHISERLSIEKLLPAAGQGALCVEFRKDDQALKKQLLPLHHPEVESCIQAERQVTIALQASCHTPVGALATIHDDQLHLSALVGLPDGSRIIYTTVIGPTDQAEQLGQQAAKQLNQQGASELLLKF